MNKTNYKKCKTETSVADLIKPKKNYLYECHCIRCGGKKVDYRTQEKHTNERCLWKSEDDRKNQENAIMARKKKYTNRISDVNSSKTTSNKSKKRKRDDPNSSTDSFPDAFPDSLPDALPNSLPDALPNSLPDAFPDSLPDAFPDSFPDFFQPNN